MNRILKYSSLSVLIALGAVTGSCQRQDPTQELAAKSSPQNVNGSLAAAMASDEAVREFLDANEQFLTADETYYASLSEEGKAARRTQLQAAFDNKSDLPDPYRTTAQVNAFHASQAQRAAQIRARFPQLAQLPEQEQAEVKAKVMEIISASSPSSASLAKLSHVFYTGCSWSNYDSGGSSSTHEACRAGYNGAMGYVVTPAYVAAPAE